MLPIVLLEIFYKVQWLILVAYPLWSKGTLAGSPAEDITSQFLWVILPIVAVPWGYVFVNYFYQPKRHKKQKLFDEQVGEVASCR
jgi:TRAP-type C4-dicarboxylate transport system permease small subunit